jgi:hypothetical protein
MVEQENIAMIVFQRKMKVFLMQMLLPPKEEQLKKLLLK